MKLNEVEEVHLKDAIEKAILNKINQRERSNVYLRKDTY